MALLSSENLQIAKWLREAADLIEQQGASSFRVHAYRRAADQVTQSDRSLAEIMESEGLPGLVALPGIGHGIGWAIAEMLETGRWSMLARLRGCVQPENLFQTLPGIGPELAKHIHDTLDVDTLEALEVAVYDGRIESVPGIGRRRAAALRADLDARLAQRIRRRTAATSESPWVEMLLDVDREYREKAAAGKLRAIAPRRFNPEHKAWLPILHSVRGRWHFTALFSNTARAHRLERTRDWVVLYFYGDHYPESQHTVVTEPRGPMRGLRVVRGREAECRAHYEALGSLPA